MNFDVSEKMQAILAMVGSCIDDVVIPLEGEFLHGTPESLDEQVRHLQQRVRQMGVWAPNHPVEVGGLGPSIVTTTKTARRRTHNRFEHQV